METFKNEIVKVARRHSERWAKFISDSTYTNQDMLKSIYYIKKNKSSSDRYYALNLTNEKTIEFRIFRGTLNYRTWLAYQQLVHNIMVQCGNLEKPVEDITWEDLTQGEYIEELCRKRDIVCYTRVVDNTKRIEDLINKRNEICDKVNKELKKYARQLLSGIKVDKSKFDNMDELYRRFANYRCGRMCSVENLLNNMRDIEKMRDSEVSIDDYILRVKDFISSNRYADLDIQMSDTMKEDILSLIRIDNGNNEEFGGEQ